MIFHRIKLAIRGFRNNKGSFLSLTLTVALGFSSLLSITAFVWGELSIDDRHQKKQRMFQILMSDLFTGDFSSTTFKDLPDKLKVSDENVELVTNVISKGKVPLRGTEDVYLEDDVIFVDTNFYSVFGFQLKEGNPSNCFDDAQSIVISSILAQSLLPNVDSYLGETIDMDSMLLKVTGVFDPVTDSHLRFNALIPSEILPPAKYQLDYPGLTYVVTKSDRHRELLDQQLNNNSTLNTYNGDKQRFRLLPLKDIYFDIATQDKSFVRTQRKETIALFSILGIIIFLITIFNYSIFLNARISQRSEQFLIHSALGAQRFDIFFNSLTEVFLTVSIGFALSFCISIAFLPQFSFLLNIELRQSILERYSLKSAALLFLSTVAILGLVLFLMTKSKSGAKRRGFFELNVRAGKSAALHALLIIQTTVSIALIIFSIAAIKQSNFIESYYTGLDQADVLAIRLDALPKNLNVQTVKNEFVNQVNVLNSSISSGTPYSGLWTSTINRQSTSYIVNHIYADNEYLKTLGIIIKDGSDFNINSGTLKGSVLINEEAAKTFNLTDSVGLKVHAFGEPLTIVGIVHNFNTASLREGINPVVIRYSDFSKFRHSKTLLLKLRKVDSRAMDNLRQLWRQVTYDAPIEYMFMEEEFKGLHLSDRRENSLIIFFSCMICVLACLGIVAITHFTSDHRMREMAIRKINGATQPDIGWIFLKQVVFWIISASMVGIPSSIFVINKWYSTYVYKVEFLPLDYILGSLIAGIMIVLCVGFSVTRLLRSNPSEILKNRG